LIVKRPIKEYFDEKATTPVDRYFPFYSPKIMGGTYNKTKGILTLVVNAQKRQLFGSDKPLSEFASVINIDPKTSTILGKVSFETPRKPEWQTLQQMPVVLDDANNLMKITWWMRSEGSEAVLDLSNPTSPKVVSTRIITP